jgi:uncharacterized protein YecT (DUF1311 family)
MTAGGGAAMVAAPSQGVASMNRFAAFAFALVSAAGLPALPVGAASFDCGAASTPFEHAICDNPPLSSADERLARTYATASGGLSEAAAESLRADQREWLDYAQRGCTIDAAPMTSGRYDAEGASCLVDLFNARSVTLETSRMISGLRFYPVTSYDAQVDPYEESGSAWGLAQHELALVQLDNDVDYAEAFNALVLEEGEIMQGDDELEDGSTDTDYSITVKQVAGTGRITLEAITYWFGHGAAHGNSTISYRHFLTEEGRFLEASDLFTGKKWQQALIDLTMAALEAEHGDALMLDGTEYIEGPIVDPSRWDLSNPYGLVVQFQPYEVSAYAYGAPTATVSWDDLVPYLTEESNDIRFGF